MLSRPRRVRRCVIRSSGFGRRVEGTVDELRVVLRAMSALAVPLTPLMCVEKMPRTPSMKAYLPDLQALFEPARA